MLCVKVVVFLLTQTATVNFAYAVTVWGPGAQEIPKDIINISKDQINILQTYL